SGSLVKKGFSAKIAEKIIKEHKGKLPQDPKTLETFPGIGHATAHSMVAFAYNQPVVFIETNIRRVFIHHFFKNKQNVHDSEIIPLVKKTLDVQNPREWYYALMDYGSYLAKQVVNPNRKSIHYMKQAQFKGSNRQIRGAILRLLSAKESVQQKDLIELGSWHTIERNLRNLIKEGLVEDNKGKYSIS
ncbi:MAG: A/G-specific adenine glycosylase, partial [Patescibacteria group bacterium]